MPGDAGNAARLLFVVTEDWAFLRHRLPMAKAALAMGLKVAVATRVSGHADAIRALGIEVFDTPVDRAGLSPIKDLRYLAHLARVFRRFRPDLIHNIAAKPVLYGTLAAKLAARQAGIINAFTGLGILYTGDRDGRRSLKSRALGRLLTALLRGTCTSPRVHMLVQNPDDRDHLLANGIGRAEHSHLIPGSGVDLDQFPARPDPPAPPIRAVLVGRLLKTKGVVEFAEAAQILKDRGRDIHMILVGAPDADNPTSVTEAELQTWARAGIVEWPGESDDVAAVWANAHIAVLPSYREGLPKSLLEAAASARPMVATDVPGCRELVKDDENGLLVPPGDAAALADAIEALATDSDKRNRFGDAARRSVEHTFSADAIGEKIAALYKAVLAEGGLSRPAGSA